MAKKQFKAESKRLLDLMIHSIYTNKEIFLRELISNASDAMDKLYYRSLTDKSFDIKQSDLEIKLIPNKEKGTLTIVDNGCGMTEKELETNLGTIAQSGSLLFKQEKEKRDDISIIGQFGVGFYSAFMVADTITVKSKAVDSDTAYCWTSSGADGYTIEPCEKAERGTEIILQLKEDTEDETYRKYLETYELEELIKKYSDYIHYPIKMDVEHKHLKEGTENEYETHVETEVINSQVPIWKKDKKKVTDEEYKRFYTDKFHDFEEPVKWIHTKVEGQYSYTTLLYIPAHAPYDYYTKEYKKGLQLYSNGVLIMDKCEDLLPDYFSFVKGLVDSEDLSLNISREMLQQDKQLRVIAKNIESKIRSELADMLEKDRARYETIYSNFGLQLKYGTYDNYGMNKDKLKDLLLFHSSYEDKVDNEKEAKETADKENKETSEVKVAKKYTTLKEYVLRMKEGQETIYYACGESLDKIKFMPQVENVLDKGYEVLYLHENIDEFVLQVLMDYEGKKFVNVSANNVDLDTKEEKEALQKANEENKDLLLAMKQAIGENQIKEVRFTHRLKNHPVCLSSDGMLSVEMEKVLNSMPNQQGVKAETILEINENHPIAKKLRKIYEQVKQEEQNSNHTADEEKKAENAESIERKSGKSAKERLENFAKVLYAQARLIEGLPVENPTELSNQMCAIMVEGEE